MSIETTLAEARIRDLEERAAAAPRIIEIVRPRWFPGFGVLTMKLIALVALFCIVFGTIGYGLHLEYYKSYGKGWSQGVDYGFEKGWNQGIDYGRAHPIILDSDEIRVDSDGVLDLFPERKKLKKLK